MRRMSTKLKKTKGEVTMAMGNAEKDRIVGSSMPGVERPRTASWAAIAFVMVLTAMFSLASRAAGAADLAGPSNPSQSTNNTSTGSTSWSYTSYVYASDGRDARVPSLSDGEISNYLVATGFNFAVPAGATINGIKVDIERADGNTNYSATIRDYSIKLIKDGAITGTNHANTGLDWPTSDQAASYGSSSDLWGQTLTSTDINAGNFGVALAVVGHGSSWNHEDAMVDNIRMTVYYTGGGSCSPGAPTVTILPQSNIISTDGGIASYSFTVTNNDTGSGCSAVTYALTAVDTNAAGFNGSTVDQASVTTAPGATSAAVNLTVNGKSGQVTGTDTTTVTASAPGHTDGTATVTTTLAVSTVCTPNAPLLEILPASQIVAPGQVATYTATVTNKDTGPCAAAGFTIAVVSDSNATDFGAATVQPGTVTLTPGQSGTATISVTANTTASNNALNTTVLRVSGDGHAAGDVSIATTVRKQVQARPLMHDSVNTGSTKWSAEGGWGIDGGKYGAFTCETCHTRDTNNIKRIRESIAAPDLSNGTIPGSGVTFNKVSGVQSVFTFGQGVLGDDTACSSPAFTDQASCAANGGTWSPRTQSDRICEVCHTITSYHRYNTTADPDGTGPLAQQSSFSHNNASDCVKCHPHSKGFKGSGDCYGCHVSVQNAVRRAVVNDTTGGDFRKPTHHVTNGTPNQIVNQDVCAVCHGNVLADKGHPGTHPADPGVDLQDPDTGEYVAADQSGIEQVCAKCHDANGATRGGLPAGASASQPFNVGSMTIKDTNTPANIGWTAGQQAHSYNAGNGAGGCLACHGNAAGADSTLEPRKNGHGSDQYKMMQFPYSASAAAYPVNNADNICYNCHGTTTANGATTAIKTQFDSIGASGGGHKTVRCLDCHDQHKAKTGSHKDGNTLAGVLNGVLGKLTTWTAASVWPSTSNATFNSGPATAEYQLCFKCHAGAGFVTGGTGAASFTDLAMEYNPNNKSRHSVGSALASGNRLATAQLTGGRCSLPEYSTQTACTSNGGTWTAWAPGAVLACSDCHATDTAGQTGPHGSSTKWMLAGVNKSWPYQGGLGNGGSSGTYWTLTNMATNKGTPNGLFCLNCHTLNASGHIHFEKSEHQRIPCVGCHLRVPHGYNQSRLIAADSGNTLPARYYQDGNGGGTKYVRSFTKASSYSSYSKSNCTTASGCH